MKRLLSMVFGAVFSFTLPFGLVSNISPVFAQSTQVARKSINFVAPKPPPTPPVKTSRNGGSGRGICPKTQLPLTALVYAEGEGKTAIVYGQTVSARPSVWFYVPYTSNDKLRGEFVLQDEQGEDVFTPQLVTLPDKPGTIAIPTPADLEIGKLYRWSFQINCDRPPVGVSGWIQRVADPTQTTTAPPEMAARYAEKGIWYDAITILGELRRTKPQDAELAQAWESLLTSVDLQDVAKEPIVK